MKILKIIIILVFGAVSLFGAIYFTDEYVAELSERDKTLAEVIMENKLEAELNKAQEQAQQELGEALVTTVMETKPVTKETTPPQTTPPITTTAEETTAAITTTTSPPVITETEPQEEESITEFTRGGILPESSEGIGFKTIFSLTPDEQDRLTRFLIDRYFLDGDVYVANETRDELKEKKAVANLMEKSAIKALNLIVAGIDSSDISSVMTADYDRVYEEITVIRDNFREEYKDSERYGESFGKLYDESLNVLNRMLEAVEKLKKSSEEYKSSTNQLLAALVLAKAVDDVIIPEIMAVLEQSFDLVEITQEIFLEGTQGTKLLSRDEVSAIIANPALILNSGLA